MINVKVLSEKKNLINERAELADNYHFTFKILFRKAIIKIIAIFNLFQWSQLGCPLSTLFSGACI